jgi:hypothetical protein
MERRLKQCRDCDSCVFGQNRKELEKLEIFLDDSTHYSIF